MSTDHKKGMVDFDVLRCCGLELLSLFVKLLILPAFVPDTADANTPAHRVLVLGARSRFGLGDAMVAGACFAD